MRAGKKVKAKLNQSLHILPALKLVWASSPKWTILRTITLSLQGLLPFGVFYLIKLIIEQVVESVKIADKAIAFQHTLGLLLLAGGAMLLTSLLSAVSEVVSAAQSQLVTDYMQDVLQSKSMAADLEYYENAQYYDALQRAQQEAPFRPNQILNRIAQILQNGIFLIVALVGLLVLHWGLAGILLIAALPALWVRLRFSKILYQWRRKRTALDRRAIYLTVMLTHEQFAKEIRLFNLGELFQHRYRKVRKQIYQENMGITVKKAIASLSAEVFAKALMVTVFIYIAYQTIQGHLQIGNLVLYLLVLQKGEGALQAVISGFSGLYEDNLFLNNLYEFLNLTPKLRDIPQPLVFPTPITQGIHLDHVSFQYVNTPRQALQDICLTIRPKETIALVGENGSGKTTLVKLLCRLYDPSAGAITIDGVELHKFAIAEVRQQISVIFQDYAKYHFSARENIWLGNIEVESLDPSVEAAAQRSGAHELIHKLPNGYDTILGKFFENGEELSIGQWQKVALARAFLRNSQLIILDEPTSAMDPKAEYEVFQKFRDLTRDQMAVIISHRLSTVKMADRIYVLSNGRITEQGTHQELIHLQGTYAQLFETQAQSYR